MITATLRIPFDKRLIMLFAPEDNDIGRARYKITQEDSHIIFSVEADDATAMRTMLTAITKTLSVWEKTEDL